MIAVTPQRFAQMYGEVVGLAPLGCWAEVVAPKTDCHEVLRLAAWRRGDGSWHITLEELNDERSEWTSQLHWSAVHRDWKYNALLKLWDPKGLAEAVAPKVGDVWDALDRVVGWTFDKMIEDDRHPGSWFLDWVWRMAP